MENSIKIRQIIPGDEEVPLSGDDQVVNAAKSVLDWESKRPPATMSGAAVRSSRF